MPAKNLLRKVDEGIFSHIYNKGVEKRIIFSDQDDYQVFLGYLRDYLSAPGDPESTKKEFMVNGRVFRGTPHLPKNYFNEVELVAYSLKPNRFHLILHQKTRGSIEKLMRSLSTRYSIYFNKKYKHSGGLFEGPYKSVQVKDEPSLLHLTRYLHQPGSQSSYAEYLGEKETSWLNPAVVLSYFGKGTKKYKEFVEKYELDPNKTEFLNGIIFEPKSDIFEGRDLTSNLEPIVTQVLAQPPENIELDKNLKINHRIPEFLVMGFILLILLALGIRNIIINTAKISKPPQIAVSVADAKPPYPPNTQVLSATEKIGTDSADVIKRTLTIKTNIATASVNIRQKPTSNSKKIFKAKDGDTFEFISKDSDWYEVKLADGSTGFVFAKYIKEEEQTK